jgi:putative hydrolase of the HAD superfamily
MDEGKMEFPSEAMPSRSQTGILFDIDGTLMDDDRAVSLALTSFHGTYGSELDISLRDLIARWRELLNLHFARYLAGGISMQGQRRARILDLFARSRPDLTPAGADRLFATYEGYYRAAWSAYADALPALEALSGFVLGVLSNGDQTQQTEKLRTTGLAPYFSGIFTSSELGSAKPSSEAFLSACRRLGISSRHCVYVGDSVETDARASASAGLTSVWLDRARTPIDASPDIHVVNTLTELPAFVTAWTERGT